MRLTPTCSLSTATNRNTMQASSYHKRSKYLPMKKFLVLFFLMLGMSTWAQKIVPPCDAMSVNEEEMKRNPQFKSMVEQMEKQVDEYLQRERNRKGNKALGGGNPVYTIPVVVHLIYTGQTTNTPANTNILNTMIQQTFDVVNANFNARPKVGTGNTYDSKLGKNNGYPRYTSPTDPKYSADSAGIKFCLATKGYSTRDGKGPIISWPLGAVLRYNGDSASVWSKTPSGSANVAKYQSQGILRSGSGGVTESELTKVGLWNQDQFYNVYLITQIDGNKGGNGTQGFAYFPSNGTTDYAVMLISGFNGTQQGSSTFTHEEGHAHNLYHTFGVQGISGNTEDPNGGTCSNSPNPETDCTTQGDKVCDTPPSKSHLGNTCSAANDAVTNPCYTSTKQGDVLHNYMDYTNCASSFTTGQIARMRAVLATAGTHRYKQAQASNVSICGCDGTNKPFAQFGSNNRNPCPGVPFTFLDSSLYGPTRWKWTFTPPVTFQPGSTDTSQNPVITIAANTTYTVKLRATNQYGADSVTKSSYIYASSLSSLPFKENFEGTTFPPKGWKRSNPVDFADTLWARNGSVGYGTGTASAWLNNPVFSGYTVVNNNYLQTPPINFSSATGPIMTFDVAYANYYSHPTDSLFVSYSTDCGVTFKRVYAKDGAAIAKTFSGTAFTPTSSQWRNESISLPALAGQGSVIFRIERGQWDAPSNRLYIDNINIVDPPGAKFKANKTTICEGDSVFFTDLSTGKPKSWSWTFPGGSPAASNLQNPRVLYGVGMGAGLHTVTLEVTDSAGTKNDTTVAGFIKVNVLPSPAFSPSNPTICKNNSINITASGGTSYAWGIGAVTPTVTVAPVNDSVFTITVTDAQGCTNSSQVTVNVNGLPTATPGAANTVCPGLPATIGGSPTGGGFGPPYTFAWTSAPAGFTANTDNAMVTPSANTTYNVLVTNVFGCTARASQTVDVFVVTPPVISGPASLCGGGSATFTSSAAQTYKWSTTETTQSITVSPTVATTYTLSITDLNGCKATGSKSLGIAGPKAGFTTNDPICLTASHFVTFTNTSTGSPVSYSWDFGDGSPLDNTAGTVSHDYYATNPAGGVYQAALTVTDASNCFTVFRKTIVISGTAPQNVDFTADQTTVCAGVPVHFTGSATKNPSSYYWDYTNHGGAADDTTATPAATHIYTAPGRYAVRFTAHNGCGNGFLLRNPVNNPTTYYITVKPSPKVIAASAKDTVCPNELFGLFGDLYATAGNGNNANAGNPSFLWSPSSAINDDPTFKNPTGSIVSNTTYTVTATTGGGCSDSSKIAIAVRGAPTASIVVSAGSTTFCEGDHVFLTATGGTDYVWSNGLTTATVKLSPTVTTTYYCTVTSANACGAIVLSQVVTVHPSPILSTSGASVICPTDNRAITVSPNGAGYSFLWSTGETTSSIVLSTSPPGIYSIRPSVTVTDAFGCTATTFRTILTPHPQVVITPASGVICQGTTTTLEAKNTTNSGARAYAWSDGKTNSIDTINSSGTYTVTLTDLYFCSAYSAPLTINSAPNPVATISSSPNPPVICSGDSVLLTASSGSAYLWSTSETTQSIYVKTDGDYYVTVFSGSCSRGSLPMHVTVHQLPDAAIQMIPSTGIVCDGDTVVLNAVTTVGNVSYKWSPTGSTGTQELHYGLGTKVYSVTITDNQNGCFSPATATATVHKLPDVSLSTKPANGRFCANDSIGLIAQPGVYTGGHHFVYFPGAVDASDTFYVHATGTYYVVVSDINDCANTSNTVSVTKDPIPITVITSNGPNVFCMGDSLVLTTDTAGNFVTNIQWSNGVVGKTRDVIKATGQYSVTVTNTYGCTQSSTSSAITVKDLGTVTMDPPSGSTTVCEGLSVPLSAHSTGVNDRYRWQRDRADIQGATTLNYTATQSGLYRIYVDSDCGSDTSAEVLVTIKPKVDPTVLVLGGPTYCAGKDNVKLFLNKPGGNGLTWQWYVDGTPIPGAMDSLYIATGSGIYSVSVSNTCNSLMSPPVKLNFYDAPKAQIFASDTTICPGSTTVLSTFSSADYQYQWYLDNNIITGANSYTYSASVLGVYTVKVSNPCTSVVSRGVHVIARPVPLLSYADTTTFRIACQGTPIHLHVNITGAYDRIEWKMDGIVMPGQVDTSLNITTAGNYKPIVYSCGVPISTLPVVQAVFYSAPVFSITPRDTTICGGSSIVLRAHKTGPQDYFWKWSPSTDSTIVLSNKDTLLVKTAGKFDLRADAVYHHPYVKNDSAVCKSKMSREVKTDSDIKAAFLHTVLSATVPPRVAFTNKSQYGIRYKWYFGDQSTSGEENPVHSYIAPGVYYVSLIAYNTNSCRDSTMDTVTVKTKVSYMPNVFTPDGDGRGDYFTVTKQAQDVHIIDGQIFDRWGKQVASFNSDEGWDGRLNDGHDAPEATYFYIVKLRLPTARPNDAPYTERGSVTLLRRK